MSRGQKEHLRKPMEGFLTRIIHDLFLDNPGAFVCLKWRREDTEQERAYRSNLSQILASLRNRYELDIRPIGDGVYVLVTDGKGRDYVMEFWGMTVKEFFNKQWDNLNKSRT